MVESAGNVLTVLKKLNDLKREMSEVDFQKAILELEKMLLAAGKENLSLQAENQKLLQTLDQIERDRQFVANLVEVEGFKYDSDNGSPRGLPYCPKCEVDGKFYRLTRSNSYYSKCPNCKNPFNAAANGQVHERPAPSTARRRRGIH